MLRQKIQQGLSYIPMLLVIIGIFYINLHEQINTFTVENNEEPSTLYFPGIVSPTDVYIVISPVSGIVTTVSADYGQKVEKGQLIYTLLSLQLEESYRLGIEDLVRNTKSYQNLLYHHNGNSELYKLGLISKIAYLDSSQQVENSELDLYESKQRLIKLLKSTGQDTLDLDKVSFEKMESVRDLLKNLKQNVKIKAPHDGFLFFPSKSLGGVSQDGDKPVKITRGVSVKEGQTLAVITNLSGILLNIEVNEIDFHKLSLGQKAKITGVAFPNIILNGVINNISRQANSSDAGSTPLYVVEVMVPNLTAEQKQVIQIGMSAEVSFTTVNPPMIKIPLNALEEKNGSYWVKVLNGSGVITPTAVEVGSTDETTITIVKGLRAGDQIVIPN